MHIYYASEKRVFILSGNHFQHDDFIKWKHFPRNWPFVWGIHRSGEFPTQRPVTRSFDVFFDLHLNKRLSWHSWGWWFETVSHPLWRHCNVFACLASHYLSQCWRINWNPEIKLCCNESKYVSSFPENGFQKVIGITSAILFFVQASMCQIKNRSNY